MVRVHSFLAGLSVLLTCSAIPLTVPIGNTGESLSVSEDGQTITVGGQTVNLHEALNGGPSSCQSASSTPTGAKSTTSSAGKSTTSTTAKAVYFISNAAENQVVALNVAKDGTLSYGSTTSTGGAGLTGKSSVTFSDSLFSQGSIKVSGHYLMAVNAGSNTVSLFRISRDNPTKLTMIGKPANTLGEFPISITISATLSQACVANSGAVAGVACFAICDDRGLIPLDTAVRPFNLNQTTPPSGPDNTVSQVFFNQDSSLLLTTVKGVPALNKTGQLAIFPVVNGTVSRQNVGSSPKGTAALFGVALLPEPGQLFVTDASFGSATLSIPVPGSNTALAPPAVLSSTKVLDQKATCWAQFSNLTKTTFVTDLAVNHLVEIDPTTGKIVNDFNSTNGNSGMLDFEIDPEGALVYAISPGNGSIGGQGTRVAVFDVSGGQGSIRDVQNFQVAAGAGLGGGSAIGMAIY